MNQPFDGDLPVPERVRLRAQQSGPHAQHWLQDLPELIQDLEREWRVRIGPALSGGSEAFVATARTADGVEAVVKLAMPGSDFLREIDTLLRARGKGYAQVLRHDLARNALLLEALGSPMESLPLSAEQSMELLCRTLQQAWLTPPAPGQEIESKAQGLSQEITVLWKQLAHPCSETIVHRALEYAQRRIAALDPDRCLVVHGDPHPANALEVISPRAGAESGFVFVDPDGFLCEPEYDLGVILRDWCAPLLAARDPLGLARRYCKLLARECHMQENAIWEWGFLERVSTGLYISAYGSRSLGQPFFDTANLLLGPVPA
jgi:streptomycin 6-kinase